VDRLVGAQIGVRTAPKLVTPAPPVPAPPPLPFVLPLAGKQARFAF
jgi:hypothetical protein